MHYQQISRRRAVEVLQADKGDPLFRFHTLSHTSLFFLLWWVNHKASPLSFRPFGIPFPYPHQQPRL